MPLFQHSGPWTHPTPALARRPDPSHHSLHIHPPNVHYLPDTVLGVAGVTVNKLRGVPNLEGLLVLWEELTASAKLIHKNHDLLHLPERRLRGQCGNLQTKFRAVWVFPKHSSKTTLFLKTRAPSSAPLLLNIPQH